MIYKLDQRIKLISAAIFPFIISVFHSISVLSIALSIVCILCFINRIKIQYLAKPLIISNIFLFFLWITVPWTVEGTTIFTLYSLNMTYEGLILALQTTLKCNTALLFFLMMIDKMTPLEIASTMEQIHIPSKLIFLFLFTFRYIDTIKEEWNRLYISAQLRGFIPSTSLHTYSTFAYMFGMTLANGIDRSRRIYEAMLLRGFNGSFSIISVPSYHHTTHNHPFMIMCICTSIILFIADCYLK